MLFPPTACEYLGEKLARLLGLHAAKYQYAIDQFHRDQKVHCARFLFNFHTSGSTLMSYSPLIQFI